ncbi:hypothetical protein [Vibrio cidicii]|jgi:hypothetical protein|uniref:hypothetical protein n=1 Tax=Vibrio cidicii TaxID=1763883 RepID=UPI003703D2C6
MKVKCNGRKHGYNTEQEAQAAKHNWICRRKRQGNPIVNIMHVYGCECGKFHIGRARGSINWDFVHSIRPTILSEVK